MANTKRNQCILCRWTKAANGYSESWQRFLRVCIMQTADDLFGTPQGSPRTDKLIDASIQWAERIMKRIDSVVGKAES